MTCNVCKTNEEIGVVSSAVGPMSFAICTPCIGHNAEPESSFIYLYDESHGEGISERMDNLTTYVDGKYPTWPQWRDDKREAEGLERIAPAVTT